MGDFSEHVLFGFLVATVVYYLLGEHLTVEPAIMLVSVLAVFVGSVFPDIDHSNSYVHRAVKAFASISAGLAALILLPLSYPERFGLAVGAILLVYTTLSAARIRHRGTTHSISFCLILASLATIAGIYLSGSVVPGMALGSGLSSHLLLDREFSL